MPRPVQQDATLGALSVALQHHVITEDIQTVCRMLGVCRSWRAAVQQSDAQSSEVVFSLQKSEQPLGQLSKAASFVRWLPKHANLLRSLTLDMPALCLSDDQQHLSFLESVDQLLAHSLEIAAAAAVVRTHSTGGAVPDIIKGLQLFSFKGSNLLSPSAVAALPAASLRELELLLPGTGTEDRHIYQRSASLPSALSRLTGLESLILASCLAETGHHAHYGVCSQCMEALSGFLHLTYLDLYMVEPIACNLQLLPPQLQQLHIRLIKPPSNDQQLQIDLSHLTALQLLDLNASDPHGKYDEFVLPEQLQTLHLGKLSWDTDEEYDQPKLASFRLEELRQLRQLSIYGFSKHSADTIQHLGVLAALEHLQRVSLMYDHASHAADTAHVWRQIPQLHTLLVNTHKEEAYGSQQALDAIIEGIAAVPWLSILSLSLFSTGQADICLHLTGLKALSELELYVYFDEDDSTGNALHLSRLTGLTNLCLKYCQWGVDDFVAAALAVSLTNLQHLNLNTCGLKTMAVIPVIAKQLTRLTFLDIDGNCDIYDNQLELLTSLTSLQSLRPGTEVE